MADKKRVQDMFDRITNVDKRRENLTKTVQEKWDVLRIATRAIGMHENMSYRMPAAGFTRHRCNTSSSMDWIKVVSQPSLHPREIELLIAHIRIQPKSWTEDFDDRGGTRILLQLLWHDSELPVGKLDTARRVEGKTNHSRDSVRLALLIRCIHCIADKSSSVWARLVSVGGGGSLQLLVGALAAGSYLRIGHHRNLVLELGSTARFELLTAIVMHGEPQHKAVLSALCTDAKSSDGTVTDWCCDSIRVLNSYASIESKEACLLYTSPSPRDS